MTQVKPRVSVESQGACVYLECGDERLMLDDGCSSLPSLKGMEEASYSKRLDAITDAVEGKTAKQAERWLNKHSDDYIPSWEPIDGDDSEDDGMEKKMTPQKKVKYVEISKDEVPAGIRFDVPRENTGQIVEVAYGCSERDRMEAFVGDPYKRVHDHSDDTVQYFRRVGRR